MSTREELESIILFRSQEGTEKDRYGNLKKAAIAAGVLGAAGGGIYAAKKIGRGVGRLAKGGEDVLKRVSGVLGEVHHNATDIGQYAHAAIPKAEAYVASTAPKVEAYVKDHIIPITEKAKGVVETMHKGLQPMRDYGALYRAGREGAFFVPKLTSNPKKWWSNVKAGWNEGRHGAPATMDPYYHDPEIAAKAQPHIERWVKRIGKTKESIAKRAPGAGRPFATSAGPVMQWSARDELSADLDRVVQFGFFGNVKSAINARRAADPEVNAAFKGLRRVGKAIARPAGIGAAGGAITGGVVGAMSDDPDSSAIGGAFKGAAIGGALGVGAGAASGALKNNSAMERLARMKRGAAARTQYVPPAGGMMGAPMLSAKHENLLTLSAELDQVINFNMAAIGKALWRGSTGRAALKWGGIGAGVGAVAGGLEGGLSDDPNKSALGGAFKGAMAGGALGALGGGGMRAYKTYGRGTTRSTRLGLGPAAPAATAAPVAAAPATATAAADQMAAGAASASSGLPAGVRPRGADELLKPKSATGQIPTVGTVPMSTMDKPWNIANYKKMSPGSRDDAFINHRNASEMNPSLSSDASRAYARNNLAQSRDRYKFSSRLQSLVQLSADLDSVLTA